MKRQYLLVAGLAVAMGLLRLAHLSADTPPFVSDDAGIYVDEGYKTLSPRNLITFGSTHPVAGDDYEGWMRNSPLTQWAHYLAFQLFGIQLETARALSIIYYTAFLFLFTAVHRNRYSFALLAAGVSALGLAPVLFFYTRVALFEPLIILFLYAFIFCLPKESPASFRHAALWAVVAAATGFGIKLSGLVYSAPIAAAIAFQLGREHRVHEKRWFLPGAAVAVVVALGVTYMLHTTVGRLAIWPPWGIARRFFDAPFWTAAAATVLPGFALSLYLLARGWTFWLSSAYRGSLLSLTLLGPAVLSLFSYQPLRYFVPFLPAYVLLIIEYVHYRHRELAGEPGRRRLHVALLAAIGVVFVAVAGSRIGRFLAEPTFQADALRAKLRNAVPPNSVVAGDWAPFFALGSEIQVLYMNKSFNPPSRAHELRPDFFLFSNNYNSNHALRLWASLDSVNLSDPLLVGCYNQTEVILYRLNYAEPQNTEDESEALKTFRWQKHRDYENPPPRLTDCR